MCVYFSCFCLSERKKGGGKHKAAGINHFFSLCSHQVAFRTLQRTEINAQQFPNVKSILIQK